MTWRKGTTYWPAYAGTFEMLSQTLPKAVLRQRSSLTVMTTVWSFCTTEAMERFLSDRKAMSQHAETTPTMRVFLWTGMNPTTETYEVWEMVDKLPPSTAPELARESRGLPPDAERQRSLPGLAESHVRCGSADGTGEEDEPV